jgi:hypothetical protein
MRTSRKTGTTVVARSVTPAHGYPSPNRWIAGGMLIAVARMKANMKTLRPLRLLSDSPGVSPIERMPSSERSHRARARIVGTY